MNNINNNINSIVLSQVDLSDNKKGATRKLALIDNKTIHWLTPEEIKSEKNRGKQITLKIDVIAKSLGNVDLKNYSLDEMTNVLNNLKWIDGKLKKHNLKVKSNVFLSIYNIYLKFRGKEVLEYENLPSYDRTKEDDLKELRLKYDDYSQLKLILRQKNDPDFNDPEAEEKKENEWKVLFQLIQADHKQTFIDLQENKEYRTLLNDYIKQNPQIIEKNPNLTHLLQALTVLEENPNFATEKGLLKTLYFIEKNRNFMVLGEIGKDSKSQEGLKKISATHLSYDIFYNTAGETVHLQKFLGRGGFKRVTERIGKDIQAIGKEKIKGDSYLRQSQREVEILEACKGKKNVIQIHKASTSKTAKGELEQVIFMEYFNMGSLNDNTENLDYKQKLQVSRDILVGAIELRDAGVIHRDYKPENILLKVDGEENITAKVADLGLACWAEKIDQDRDKVVGTVLYMPPNIETNPASYQNDIWSLGMLFTDLFYKEPYYDKYGPIENLDDVKKMASKINRLERPQDESSIDFVIWSMLRNKLMDRMSLNRALSIVETELEEMEKNF